jgi:hypothetical protein
VNEATVDLKAKYKEIKVLGIDSVITTGKSIKFDTPPVIKEGRTLIPIRAITEGFGAEVSWNAETQEVTITKDDKVIILKIGSNTMLVNGEEIQIDAKSEIMNGRTVVPLRFVIENLGLKAEWDDETETIEIVEAETETNEELGAVVETESEEEIATDNETEPEVATEGETEPEVSTESETDLETAN